MVKILAKAGDSLADVYDVEGSIAGIDHLETHELPIVHEMGGTVFSERFSTQIFREPVVDQAQSTGWNRTVSGMATLNAPYMRILGCAVFVDVTSRVDLASISLDSGDGEDFPIWSWDAADDIETSVRYVTGGAATATTIFLRPTRPYWGSIPHIQALAGQPQSTPSLIFRGISSAFGAGTVDCAALIHVGFPRVQGLSSRGLPVPSW